METEKFVQMLEHHGVRPTANRIVIVGALARMGHPASMTELEKYIVTIDKSGIYRALSEFKKRNLVHTIDGGDGEVKYELCHRHSDDWDDDRHAHFYCEHCRRTICLTDVAIPHLHVPDGFVVDSVNYMVKGLCPDCARKQAKYK